MKYRIITDGEGFVVRCKFRYWPFWIRLFDPGSGWFRTIEDAERAIARTIEHQIRPGHKLH
jgi:hypothetical protein